MNDTTLDELQALVTAVRDAIAKMPPAVYSKQHEECGGMTCSIPDEWDCGGTRHVPNERRERALRLVQLECGGDVTNTYRNTLYCYRCRSDVALASHYVPLDVHTMLAALPDDEALRDDFLAWYAGQIVERLNPEWLLLVRPSVYGGGIASIVNGDTEIVIGNTLGGSEALAAWKALAAAAGGAA
jgi:hypothetical protein